MAGSSFRFSSYNIRGLSSNNITVVNNIISKFKEDNVVIGIQEHFQMQKTSESYIIASLICLSWPKLHTSLTVSSIIVDPEVD